MVFPPLPVMSADVARVSPLGGECRAVQVAPALKTRGPFPGTPTVGLGGPLSCKAEPRARGPGRVLSTGSDRLWVGRVASPPRQELERRWPAAGLLTRVWRVCDYQALCDQRQAHCAGAWLIAELPSNSHWRFGCSHFSHHWPHEDSPVSPGLGSENPAWELGETFWLALGTPTSRVQPGPDGQPRL